MRPAGRLLVTGANGFVGRHAVRHLAEAGYDVVPLSGVDHDLTQSWPNVGSVEGVLHLAGLAAVGPSFDDPQLYLTANSAMMTHLGEWLLATEAFDTRVLVVSTGGVYGASAEVLTEASACTPTSPYVVSKMLVENQADYYRNRGLDVIVARPFNHIGPGQGPGFLVPDLAERLRAFHPGSVLSTGNLASSRDYTDVRDVVNAYRSLLELDAPLHAVYNVASGTSHTGHQVLEALADALGVTVESYETATPRQLDPDVVMADASRLRNETGWSPTIDFDRSIRDFVES